MMIRSLIMVCAAVLSLAMAGPGGESFHVAMVVDTEPPVAGFIHTRRLVSVTQSDHKNIADLNSKLLVGGDRSTLSFLELADTNMPTDWRLLTLDRASSTLLADTLLHNVTPAPRIQTVECLMAVESNQTKVYFPTIDFKGHRFGFAGADWNTGEVQVRTPYEGMGNVSEFIPLPKGFAIRFSDSSKPFPQPTVALFDAMGQGMRLVPLAEKYSDSSKISQLIFLPTVGLVEYRNGDLFRLTGALLSTNSTGPERVVAPNLPDLHVNSTIFARIYEGKPCLFWGEDNVAAQPEFGFNSEIVVFDWNSKRVLLRKSLGTSAATFQPDDGSRIYFLDPQNGKTMLLEVAAQKITTFSDEPVRHPDHAVIVDAY